MNECPLLAALQRSRGGGLARWRIVGNSISFETQGSGSASSAVQPKKRKNEEPKAF